MAIPLKLAWPSLPYARIARLAANATAPDLVTDDKERSSEDCRLIADDVQDPRTIEEVQLLRGGHGQDSEYVNEWLGETSADGNEKA